MFLIQFAVSGLIVSLYFWWAFEGEGIPPYPLFFSIFFVVILLNKVPKVVRQRLSEKVQAKAAAEAAKAKPNKAAKARKQKAKLKKPKG